MAWISLLAGTIAPASISPLFLLSVKVYKYLAGLLPSSQLSQTQSRLPNKSFLISFLLWFESIEDLHILSSLLCIFLETLRDGPSTPESFR